MHFELRLALLAMLVSAAVMAAGVDIAPTLAVLAGVLLGLIVWGGGAKSGGMAPPPATTAERQVLGSLAVLIESIEMPVILLDAGLGVEAHNRAARDVFPRLRLREPLSPAVRNPELLKAAESALASRALHSVEIIDRSPVERRLMVLASPVVFERPQPGVPPADSHLLLQIRDLSEQDRLAQTRSDFVANASHELRTPLASLRGFIETLRGPARNDAAAREKFLLIMEQQAARMSRILDDMLSLSRIEMRTHLLPEAKVDLGQIAATAIRSLDPLAKAANIAIDFTAPVEAFSVRGDRDELEQVFQNLIQNAIKYGRAGGKVAIGFRRLPARGSRPERIAVSVADDGPGIAAEHLPRLTERFYRVDTAASRERGGTGLGLAIVKHILTRHHGELEVTSQLGKGSKFSVIIDAPPSDKNIIAISSS